jgi:hypothetical protein
MKLLTVLLILNICQLQFTYVQNGVPNQISYLLADVTRRYKPDVSLVVMWGNQHGQSNSTRIQNILSTSQSFGTPRRQRPVGKKEQKPNRISKNALTGQNFTHLPHQWQATRSEKLLTKEHKHTLFSKSNPPKWGNSNPQPGNIIQTQRKL